MAPPAGIAVVGAGGGVGLECVQQLAAQGAAPRAIVRDPAKYAGKFGEAEVVAGDVTDEASLAAAFAGCRSVVFAASGNVHDVDHLGVVRTANAAKAAGVERVVLVSSMYVDGSKFGWKGVRMILNTLRWGLMDAKWLGEEALRSHGIDYTIVRPGGLDHGLKAGGPPDHVLVMPRDAELAGLPAGARSVWRTDVAAVVCAALGSSAVSRATLEVMARPACPDDPPFAERALFEGITKD